MHIFLFMSYVFIFIFEVKLKLTLFLCKIGLVTLQSASMTASTFTEVSMDKPRTTWSGSFLVSVDTLTTGKRVFQVNMGSNAFGVRKLARVTRGARSRGKRQVW